MFLGSRLKSKNPDTRIKAISEQVRKTSMAQGRSEAFAWVIGQMRTEQDPAVVKVGLGMVDEVQRLIDVACDNAETEAFRVAAIHAFADKMHERMDVQMGLGRSDEACRLKDVLAEECRGIAASSTSEAVREAAREAMGEPEPVDLVAALTARPSAEDAVNLLLAERDPIRVGTVLAYLESLPTPKTLERIEGAFCVLMSNRADYDYSPEIMRRLLNLYAKWAGTTSKAVELKFTTRDELEQLERDLNSDNVMASMSAQRKLQELWRAGKYTSEISRMKYNGQPVATYRDPNAGTIITAPTH